MMIFKNCVLKLLQGLDFETKLNLSNGYLGHVELLT